MQVSRSVWGLVSTGCTVARSLESPDGTVHIRDVPERCHRSGRDPVAGGMAYTEGESVNERDVAAIRILQTARCSLHATDFLEVTATDSRASKQS